VPDLTPTASRTCRGTTIADLAASWLLLQLAEAIAKRDIRAQSSASVLPADATLMLRCQPESSSAPSTRLHRGGYQPQMRRSKRRYHRCTPSAPHFCRRGGLPAAARRHSAGSASARQSAADLCLCLSWKPPAQNPSYVKFSAAPRAISCTCRPCLTNVASLLLAKAHVAFAVRAVLRRAQTRGC